MPSRPIFPSSYARSRGRIPSSNHSWMFGSTRSRTHSRTVSRTRISSSDNSASIPRKSYGSGDPDVEVWWLTASSVLRATGVFGPAGPGGSAHGDLGDALHAALDVLLAELDLGEVAGQVVVVGLHVEVAVAAQVEHDHSLLAGLLRRHRLVDRRADGVVRLGRRDDPLRPGELHACLEHLVLRVGAGLHESLPNQQRDGWR